MLISNRRIAGSAQAFAIDAFVADLSADVAALQASFNPVFLTAAPAAPIVAPGLYLIARSGLTIALGTPTVWRGGLVTIKDFTQGQPNATIAGAIDGGAGALINVVGEALSFAWSIDDNYWVTT